MRVIAGKLKGRTIKAVPGKGTRPTGDKIKEAAFHKMGPFFSEGTGLDLFAGSGSLGIEAISRGFDHMYFIDQAKQAIQTIHKNLHELQIEEKGSVYRNDAFRAMKVLHKKDIRFDLILLDPPYEKISYEDVISQIVELRLIKQGGYIYTEHGPDMLLPLDEDIFTAIFSKKYNETTSVTIYRKQ